MGSRGLGYCSIFSGEKTGGKTEDGVPSPWGLRGIPLRLRQGMGVPRWLEPRNEAERWKLPPMIVGGVVGRHPPAPPVLARTWTSLGSGVLLRLDPLSMVSPGQEAQNIHVPPSKSCPVLSSNSTGPSWTSFCSIDCIQGPRKPVSPLLWWVLPLGLCSCQALPGYPTGCLSECSLLLAWWEACLFLEGL